jgi:hypothetical protein
MQAAARANMKKPSEQPEGKWDASLKRAAYITLLGLIVLILYGAWISDPDRKGNSSLFFSDRMMDIVITACLVLAAIAIGYAVFIVLRAFYLGLTADRKEGP